MNDAPIDAPEAIDAPEDAAAITRPADVPEKFWDDEAGAVRIDALLKSYLELERKLGLGPARAGARAGDAPAARGRDAAPSRRLPPEPEAGRSRRRIR